MKVKPAKPGTVVRDPVSRLPLPGKGKKVDDGDIYWHRKIRSGDVVLVEGDEDEDQEEPQQSDADEPTVDPTAPTAPLTTRPVLPGVRRHEED